MTGKYSLLQVIPPEIVGTVSWRYAKGDNHEAPDLCLMREYTRVRSENNPSFTLN